MNFLVIMYGGKPLPKPQIPRDIQTLGQGSPKTYAVLGDSTAVGLGGDYKQGIAMETARHIGKRYTVRFQNFAIAGARTHDVLHEQVPRAVYLKPDFVLLAVGANDVTRRTPLSNIKSDMQAIITKFITVNPRVKIILTGAPAMGVVPRIPQPLRYLAGKRTKQINAVMAKITQKTRVYLAPIAQRTGPILKKQPHVFAPDNFHPNTTGYRLWSPILNRELDIAQGRS